MIYKERKEIIITGEQELASIWIRLLAFITDFIFLMLLFLLIGNILYQCGVHFKTMYIKEFNHVEFDKSMDSGNEKVLTWVFSSIPVIYFTLVTYFSNGKTIGKLIFRIRIQSVYHHKIQFWHCLERSLGYAASTLEGGLGFIQAFWNPNRMSLHDKIAETVVIKQPLKKERAVARTEVND